MSRKGRMGVGGGGRQHGSFRSFCLRCRYCGQELIFASTGMTLELASAYRDVYQENCLASSAQAAATTTAGNEEVRAVDGQEHPQGLATVEEPSSTQVNLIPSMLSSKE